MNIKQRQINLDKSYVIIGIFKLYRRGTGKHKLLIELDKPLLQIK